MLWGLLKLYDILLCLYKIFAIIVSTKFSPKLSKLSLVGCETRGLIHSCCFLSLFIYFAAQYSTVRYIQQRRMNSLSSTRKRTSHRTATANSTSNSKPQLRLSRVIVMMAMLLSVGNFMLINNLKMKSYTDVSAVLDGILTPTSTSSSTSSSSPESGSGSEKRRTTKQASPLLNPPKFRFVSSTQPWRGSPRVLGI